MADIPDDVPVPLGDYKAVIVRGDMGFVSGQFPIRHGQLAYKGRVGAELTPQQGREASLLAALNVIGQLRKALAGNFERVRLARLDGYVASAPDFHAQPAVLDGASEAFVQLLGERGEHARAAFAVSHLPRDAAIELVVTFHVGGLNSEGMPTEMRAGRAG